MLVTIRTSQNRMIFSVFSGVFIYQIFVRRTFSKMFVCQDLTSSLGFRPIDNFLIFNGLDCDWLITISVNVLITFWQLIVLRSSFLITKFGYQFGWWSCHILFTITFLWQFNTMGDFDAINSPLLFQFGDYN